MPLTRVFQLDISDDGFLSLMNEEGDTKDDVRMPDGEIGEKIERLFKTEEKDTSRSSPPRASADGARSHIPQTLSFSPPWVRRPPLRPRRLPARVKQPFRQ